VLARLFPNGQRDTGFAPAGLPDALWTGIALTADGRVTILGQVQSGSTSMLRLHPDGTADNTFTLAAGLGNFNARPLQLDPAGRAIIKGFPGTWMKRLDASGAVDGTFEATNEWLNPPQVGVVSGWNTHAVAPDGKIYGGGFFDRVNGVSSVKIVAFEGDATADSFSFDSSAVSVVENGGFVHVGVTRLGSAVSAGSVSFATANGSALAGTDFTATSGTLTWAAGESGTKFITVPIIDNGVANSAREFSLSLSSPSGGVIAGSASLNIPILDDEGSPVIVSQPDSITVKQGFTATFSVAISSAVPPTFQWFKDGDEMPGETSSVLVLTNVDADDEADYTVEVSAGGATVPSDPATLTVIPPATALDLTYHPAITENTAPVVYLADGSLLAINGAFNTGYTVQKFDATGALAATWPLITTNASNGSLTLTPLPGGQFLASGSFTLINGVSRTRIARLDADGSVDESFDAGLSNVSSFSGPVVTSSGAVYLFWKPSSQNGALIRLLENGASDPSFTTTLIENVNGYLHSLVELPDGSLLVGYTSGSLFPSPAAWRN
jgi:hypothetical protein